MVFKLVKLFFRKNQLIQLEKNQRSNGLPQEKIEPQRKIEIIKNLHKRQHHQRAQHPSKPINQKQLRSVFCAKFLKKFSHKDNPLNPFCKLSLKKESPLSRNIPKFHAFRQSYRTLFFQKVCSRNCLNPYHPQGQKHRQKSPIRQNLTACLYDDSTG